MCIFYRVAGGRAAVSEAEAKLHGRRRRRFRLERPGQNCRLISNIPSCAIKDRKRDPDVV